MHSSVLAYSPEQRLGERWGEGGGGGGGGGGWLGSLYLLHSGRNETPRIRRQPVCVIPSGNPTLTGARKKKETIVEDGAAPQLCLETLSRGLKLVFK